MTGPRRAPLVIVNAEIVAETRELLSADGWQLKDGWVLPDEPWDVTEMRVVCVGAVANIEHASLALLAAARGAGLAVSVELDNADADHFFDDLRHLEAPGLDRTTNLDAPIDADQRQLLELLAQGRSLAQAAKDLFLSQRTAERRLSAARRALGVTSTAEALVALRGTATT